MNTKISALPVGEPAQITDLIPIARAGANFSISAGSIAALAEANTHWSALVGSLTETQVIPWDGPTPGTKDTVIWRSATNTVSIGLTGSTPDASGTLNCALFEQGTSDSTDTALGLSALSTGLGSHNTAIGTLALAHTSSSTYPYSSLNTAVGYRALDLTTTGSTNTAVGNDCLEQNTTGSQNTAYGHDALNSTSTTNANTAIGWVALQTLTTGSYNTALGTQSGSYFTGGGSLTSATASVFLGYNTGAYADGDSNEIVIAGSGLVSAFTYGAGSNTTVIGDSHVTDTYFGSSSAASAIHAAAGYFSDTMNLASGKSLEWSAGSNPAGISYLGAASLAIGNGASGDVSGNLKLTSTTFYNSGGNYVIYNNAGSGIAFGPNTSSKACNLFAANAYFTGGFNSGNGGDFILAGYAVSLEAGIPIKWSSGNSSPTATQDTSITRGDVNTITIGLTGSSPDASGQLNLKKVVLTDFGSTPTSTSGGGTAGTVGEIVQHSGLLYFCSVTGGAGSATWNVITMTPSA